MSAWITDKHVNPIIKVGDKVLLNSPKYGVIAALCEVVKCQGKPDFRILDDTKFSHNRFRESRRHVKESGDTWILVRDSHFEEGLFTL